MVDFQKDIKTNHFKTLVQLLVYFRKITALKKHQTIIKKKNSSIPFKTRIKTTLIKK